MTLELSKNLFLDSLSSFFESWKNELPTVTSIQLKSSDADSAGLQLILAIKKNYPMINITIVSQVVIDKAKLLGVYDEIVGATNGR